MIIITQNVDIFCLPTDKHVFVNILQILNQSVVAQGCLKLYEFFAGKNPTSHTTCNRIEDKLQVPLRSSYGDGAALEYFDYPTYHSSIGNNQKVGKISDKPLQGAISTCESKIGTGF